MSSPALPVCADGAIESTPLPAPTQDIRPNEKKEATPFKTMGLSLDANSQSSDQDHQLACRHRVGSIGRGDSIAARLGFVRAES